MGLLVSSLAALSVALGSLAGAAGPARGAGSTFTWNVEESGYYSSAPAPLTQDDQTLVVAATMQGDLVARDGAGRQLWRSPIDPAPGRKTPSQSPPSIGDITGDGTPEVVVGAGDASKRTPQGDGGVVAYRADGTVLWRFRTRDTFNTDTGGGPDGYSDGVVGAASLGDVDGDGVNDVVFGSFDHFIYALNGKTGRPLPGFPYDSWDTIFSTPALADIDPDPGLEIVIGGDATRNTAMRWTARGVLRVINPTASGPKQLWVRQFGDVVAGAPAVHDVNNDGQLEVVFTTGGYYNNHPDSRRLWVLRASDGATRGGFPQALDANTRTSVAIGDVTPRRGVEIVVADRAGGLYAYSGGGRRVWKSFPGAQNRGNNGIGFDGGVSIGDLDGDGDQDIAAPYGFGGALLVDGATGNLMQAVGNIGFASVAAPAIVDFGGGHGRQLVVAGFRPTHPDGSAGGMTGVALPRSTSPEQWGMFHQTPDRRGAPSSGRVGENVSFAYGLYHDMLNRAPVHAGAQSWARQATLSSSRGRVIRGFQNSEEYRRGLIRRQFAEVLGRDASAASQGYWSRQLRAGRVSIDSLPIALASSGAFYAAAGGNDDTYIRSLFTHFLGRQPSAASMGYWRPRLARSGRAAVAKGIYSAAEAGRRRAAEVYSETLRRSPSATEVERVLSTARFGGAESLRARLLVTREYLYAAVDRFPQHG